MTPRKPFVFIRHGQTDWNLQRKAQGSTDIPLNETGRAQARAAVELLRPLGLTRVAASPLGRARETAEILAEGLGISGITLEPDLREAGFGVLEGTPWSESFAAFYAGTLIPEGGESFVDFQARTLLGLRRALQDEGLPLIVAHGGVWKALRGALDIRPRGVAPNCVPLSLRPQAESWIVEGDLELEAS
ncbi:histidine phosphatase family protein [Neomegalonema perideroedes]|uniref:histidine phosphatase family protein n=1 Tax=Neomegalonema perideroedes TaxID=217219 RepID=UPI0003687660|nr:histidine phosphatase family protein [Neomegalonema perideroedes]